MEAERFTVLVVEDEATHQMLIRKALTGEGTAFSLVQFTRDSEEAVRFARQMAFDVLLVDNRIPGTRGLDLLTELREAGVTAPFVLMTSAGSEGLVVEAYRQKVADYVIKDSGFWKELPQVLLRVIAGDRAKRREQELHARYERTNAKLEKLNADIRLRTEAIREKVRALRAAVDGLGPTEAAALRSLVEEIEALL
ncbi:MAG: response regulator [Deltaproteobacteria bacterium]|nr:MAG: response regulator [Deltaproteobacteria bacterium]